MLDGSAFQIILLIYYIQLCSRSLALQAFTRYCRGKNDFLDGRVKENVPLLKRFL